MLAGRSKPIWRAVPVMNSIVTATDCKTPGPLPIKPQSDFWPPYSKGLLPLIRQKIVDMFVLKHRESVSGRMSVTSPSAPLKHCHCMADTKQLLA